MYLYGLISFVLVGLVAVSTNAAPVSPNHGAMSTDWSHVFAPGISKPSTIEPGASMASIKAAGDIPSGTITFGNVVNFCSFPIYARLAVAERSSAPPYHPCEHFGETEDIEVPPFGGRWVAPYSASWDQCGHTVKISRNLGDRDVYQVEYSLDPHDGRMWYNLSAWNGAPFQDVDRLLLGAVYRGQPACPIVHCLPGHYGKDPVHGCDWPLQPVCDRPGTIYALMCGSYIDGV